MFVLKCANNIQEWVKYVTKSLSQNFSLHIINYSTKV